MEDITQNDYSEDEQVVEEDEREEEEENIFDNIFNEEQERENKENDDEDSKENENEKIEINIEDDEEDDKQNNEQDITTVEYNKNQNQLIKSFMEKLFKSSKIKELQISRLFDSEELREFNHKKKYDEKKSKFGFDDYGLLIRENKFNKQNDFYGWKIDETTNRPININVTDKLKLTKTRDEIFDIIMLEYTVNSNKVNLTTKSIPYQVFKILDKNVDKYITKNKKSTHK